ncbi:hypothetical protein PN36_18285, partial [Candidatus Thiomargarita nelsonii]
PNDFVYIFYSGHGSQTKDLNGDEPSGYDQTWVSYGARTGRQGIDNYDVLDDEIDKWLSNLYEKTQNVVFISDSCHSATVTRGAAATSRAIKEDKRPHLLDLPIMVFILVPHEIMNPPLNRLKKMDNITACLLGIGRKIYSRLKSVKLGMTFLSGLMPK